MALALNSPALVFGAGVLFALGLGAGIYARPEAPPPVAAEPASCPQPEIKETPLPEVEDAPPGDLAAEVARLRAQVASLRKQRKSGAPQAAVEEPPPRPRRTDKERAAQAKAETKAEGDEPGRFVRYMALRPFREYRRYKSYRKGDANEYGSDGDCAAHPFDRLCRGTAAHCKEDPAAPECQGTRVHCEANPTSQLCAGTEAYCGRRPGHETCAGTVTWCGVHKDGKGCAGTKHFCLDAPNQEACFGTAAFCAQTQGDTPTCAADES